MPNLETPPELADWLADKLGIYGACKEHQAGEECKGDCRPHWTMEMAERIRQAAINENQLNSLTGNNGGSNG